jgi:hypothetical protein
MLCAILALLPAVACHAAMVWVQGRMVDTEPRAPFMPTSQEECARFRADASAAAELLSTAHQECLDSSAGSGAPEMPLVTADGRRLDRCSKAPCQSLHTARDDLQKSVSDGYRSCLQEVSARQDSGAKGFDSATDDDRFDDVRYAAGRVASGPLAVVRRFVSKATSEMIGELFGAGSSYVRGGVQATAIANAMWKRTESIQRECERDGGPSSGKSCSREIVKAVSGLKTSVPARYRGDPAIGLIQQAMLERLAMIHGDLADNLDRFEQQVQDFGQDTGHGSDAHGPVRSRRRQPIIENQ